MMSIYDKFVESVNAYGERPFLAELQDNKYKPISYRRVLKEVNQLAQGLHSLGLQTGDHLAVLMNNGSDWIIIDLACAQLGIIHVPIHTTYNFDNISHVLSNSDSRNLIIGSEFYEKYKEQLDKFQLERIVIDTGSTDDNYTNLFKQGLTEESLVKSADDVHTIIYTSGTTGKPKGVMLTHHNIIFDVVAAKNYIDIKDSDRFFSFLPLSHVLERTGGYYTPMISGSAIYFATSQANLAHDIKIAKPTVMLSVPRIFEKVYEKIMAKIEAASPKKKELFFKAIKLKRQKMLEKLSFDKALELKLLELLVIRKIKASLGGHLRFAISGGASLDKQIARFFESIGIKIIEGYGLTETSPIVAENKLDHYKFGTVGLPLPGIEVKLGADKEILVKGDCVMKGYYNNPEATNEVIDSEGWLHTGDQGYIDSDGYLTIIGRSKEVIILSTGKNINPVNIEQALNINKYITQSMVYGNKQKKLSAIIVPDFAELALWLSGHDFQLVPQDSLDHPQVQALFAEQIKQSLEKYDKIEQVSDFMLVAEEFTQENGLVTPTLKMRRGRIADIYAET